MIEDIQFWLARFVADLLVFVLILAGFFGLLIGSKAEGGPDV